MKYYLIAGEASGDLHGANLMEQIKLLDPEAEFRFWGGDLMQEQGGTLVKHYQNLAFMGFIEVVQNLGTILKNIKFCKEDISRFKPDYLILIDYPGFNLRIAKHANKQAIKVIYYISPQLWAWKSSRVKTIKKFVDKMLVILPFEKDFYRKYNYDVSFVGHPLLDALEKRKYFSKSAFLSENNLEDRPIIAVLPGSRNQEISTMLPIMLAAQKDFPTYQFVVAGAPSKTIGDYKKYLKNGEKIVFNQTYDLLKASQAAMVTSGTATLEAALLGVPEVVCYKGSEISYQIGKRLVKNISYISLVNLIMNREVVKELIQNELTHKNLVQALENILTGKKRKEVLNDYALLKEKLGGRGASYKAAKEIVTK